MNPKGLFVGITTVDLQYLVDAFPEENLKTNSSQFHLSTGGPATNAAVAFSYLGGRSALVSEIGQHAFTRFIREELALYDIDVVDLSPSSSKLPTFSSIFTTKSSGDRSIVSFTTDKAVYSKSDLPQISVDDFDILLVDGLQMQVSQLISAQAKQNGIPVVLDGGSWKNGMETLLKFVDVAICSADFRPPGTLPDSQPAEVLDYLAASGVTYAAITRGEKPILFYDGDKQGELPVKQLNVVDTLGAGDIFHGAFCYYFSRLKDFEAALGHASRVAAKSCASFGTREWMNVAG